MSRSGLLVAEGLSYGYGRQGLLFEGWDGCFDAGEVVAITGASGRGKSTLLYLLGLMVAPKGGRVLVAGRSASDLDDLARAALRAEVFGFVFQDAVLDLTRTVVDNIVEACLYRREATEAPRRRAVELMEEFGVEVGPDRLPGQLSGGQAQRVALCRALLHEPRVVLADEPTGNLDAGSAGVVIDALHAAAARGAAVAVATHDPALVARCTRRLDL